MRPNGHKKYSAEEKMAIIREYEESDFTQEEIARKYGIHSRTSIVRWREKFGSTLQNAEKVVSLQRQNQIILETMQSGTPEERIAALEKELKATQDKLKKATMKVQILDTMIDIAERQGIKIRKNSGAKR